MPEADEPAIGEEHVDQVESWIDTADEELEPLEEFILPGGGGSGATLHHARAVTRRAERRAVELGNNEPINGEALTYLNRLSDALFTFGRLVNARDDVPESSPSY
jgi:ATP:cob(I)alamin adenosyltransferase